MIKKIGKKGTQKNEKFGAIKKYLGLLISFTVFLLLVMAFIALSWVISLRNANNNQLVSLLGEQKTISQQISKEIMLVDKGWKESEKVNRKYFDSMLRNSKDFETILHTLRTGEAATIKKGSVHYAIEKPVDQADLEIIKKIEDQWSPLKKQIEILNKSYQDAIKVYQEIGVDNLVTERKTRTFRIDAFNKDKVLPNDYAKSHPGEPIPAEIKTASDKQKDSAKAGVNSEITQTVIILKSNNINLLRYVEELNAKVISDVGKQKSYFETVQIGMLLLCGIFFTVVIFVFTRKLVNTDALAQQEASQKSAILNNVNEVLFIITEQTKQNSEGEDEVDYIIGEQVSSSMKTVFGDVLVPGMSFKTWLQHIVDNKTLDASLDFINEMFNGRMVEKLTKHLCPLNGPIEIESSATGKIKRGSSRKRYISVQFVRIKNEKDPKKVSSLLVTVSDSTESHLLKKELAAEKTKSIEQFRMIINLAKHARKDEISAFLEKLKLSIVEINHKFSKENYREHAVISLIEETKNITHGLKSEAGLLGIEMLQRRLHDLESALIEIEESKVYNVENLLKIPYDFEDIEDTIDLMQGLMAATKKTASQTASDSQVNLMRDSIRDLINKVCAESKQPKRIDLLMEENEWRNHTFWLTHFDDIKTILLHMVGNAAYHGIEPSAERVNKEQRGLIRVNCTEAGELDNPQFVITVTDDGKGIDFELIRKSLVDKGLVSKEIAEKLSQGELLKSIFKSGLSTAGQVNQIAGRGVGLAAAMDLIKKLGGTINVTSRQGAGTRFTMKFAAATYSLGIPPSSQVEVSL